MRQCCARSTSWAYLRAGGLSAVLAANLLLAGCGNNTTNDTALFLRQNNEGDTPIARFVRVVNGGPFDELLVSGPSDVALQGTVTIAFSVKDTDTGGEIDIIGDYSTDGGVTWISTINWFLNPSQPAVFPLGARTYNHAPDMSTDPAIPGVNCVDLVWNTVADLGVGVQVPRVMFRITPNDRTDGGVATIATFGVDNSPSVFAPEIDNITTPTVLPNLIFPGGPVTFTFRARDTDAPPNLVGLCPFFSLDGPTGPFLPATEAPNPPSVSQGTFGLVSSATGVSHVFVWDSAADFATAGVLCAENVVFRLEPKDIGTILSVDAPVPLVGIADDSGEFTVANFPASPNRGTANVPTPIGVQAGCIQIPYSIADADSSLSAVVIEFSTDGGATFRAATPNSEDPENEGFCGSAGLSTSPIGVRHVFTWDSISDGVAGLLTGVVIRVTPFDGLFGTPGSTGLFTLNNPAVSPMSAPGLSITTPELPPGQSAFSDAINIGYLLFDLDSDPVDIEGSAEFSVDGGLTWLTATARMTAAFSGTVGLTSSPCGTSHIFVWDSLCDMVGLSGPETALFRIAPTDIHGIGAFDSTGPFLVENLSLPTIVADNPVPVGTAPFAGNVTILYDLVATVPGSCGVIICEFSRDSGVTYTTCIEVLGPPSEGTSGLSVDTVASTHTFVWDTVANAVGLGGVAQVVQVRIRPFLVGVEGTSDFTTAFTVQNP